MAVKHNIPLPLILLSAMLVAGCTIEEVFYEVASIDYRGEPVEAFLDISVGGLSVSTGTRADAADLEDSEAERWVNDLWVFQYNAGTGIAVADPIYIVLDGRTENDVVYDQSILENMPVTLSDNVGDESIIYVVTNTGDSSWGPTSNHNTVDGLLTSALPMHEPIFFTDTLEVSALSIPMEGDSGNVTVVQGKSVRVPVSRMYAKIMIDPYVNIDIEVETTNDQGDPITVKGGTAIYSVGVGNIPLYCRVGSLWDEVGTSAASYPDGVQWVSRAFDVEETAGGSTGSGGQGDESGSDEDDSDDAPEDLGYRYIMYVPENLQGVVVNGETSKTENAPSHAMQINIVITYTDPIDFAETRYPYTVYPGMNSTNDFNIRRNNIYRVKVNINELSTARTPSANSFFAYAGHTISFYPYNNEDTGGGYKFSDYVNPDEEDKKIDRLEIIWQTENCIGDNSDGSLVYLDTDSPTHTGYEQIHVHTQKEGNALIGAYNSSGDIIWSWHIWVRSEDQTDPTHPANALIYYTYDWDESGIYSYYRQESLDGAAVSRIAGYEIMSCNIGALQDEPNWGVNPYMGEDSYNSNNPDVFVDGDGIVRTFGMMYQWGRKDPFPPLTTTLGGGGSSWKSSSNASNVQYYNTGYYVHDYSDEHTEQHYDNAMNPVHKTSYDENGPTYTGSSNLGAGNYLFHSHVASSDEGVRYAIAHPTVFLCGTELIAEGLELCYREQYNDSTQYVREIKNYPYRGAWSEEDHESYEWGGLTPDSSMKHYELPITDDTGHYMSIYDDYGDEKSIFDPCPYGWRVGSGDMWLGFTRSGINPYNNPWDTSDNNTAVMENINYEKEKSCYLGMTMYLGSGWRDGGTSWFPIQGFILPDGCGYRVGGCGNYTNANTDDNDLYDRVNMLHIHCDARYFKQFENQLQYTAKSTANPLRCVRDSK